MEYKFTFECGCQLSEGLIIYCPMHATAPKLLEVAEETIRDIEFRELGLEKLEKKLRAIVASAKGVGFLVK